MARMRILLALLLFLIVYGLFLILIPSTVHVGVLTTLGTVYQTGSQKGEIFFLLPDGVSANIVQTLSTGRQREYSISNGTSWPDFVVLNVNGVEHEVKLDEHFQLQNDLYITYLGKETINGQLVHRFLIWFRWYWPF